MERRATGAVRTALRILFGALLLLAFFLFVLWRTENARLKGLRVALIDASAPLLEMVAGPSSGLSQTFDGVKTLSELQVENALLKEKIRDLEGWEDRAKRLEQENAQLRALSAVTLPPRWEVVTGEVVADSGGPFSQSVIVNSGYADGVRDGAPAIDSLGLVGRVAGVGQRTARVLLLTDVSSHTPVHVHIGLKRRRAILAGDDSPSPILRYVDGDEPVPEDARVTTSGDGGVFPKGLLVGAVASQGDGLARVRLAADYGNMDFLRIYRAPKDRIDAGPSRLILTRPGAEDGQDAGAAHEAGEETTAGAASGVVPGLD